MKKKSTSKGSGVSWGKIAFITFVSAAVLYLVQAILAKVGVASQLIRYAQAIVTVILFVLAGGIAWKYVRSKKTVHIILFLLATAVIIVSVILPII